MQLRCQLSVACTQGSQWLECVHRTRSKLDGLTVTYTTWFSGVNGIAPALRVFAEVRLSHVTRVNMQLIVPAVKPDMLVKLQRSNVVVVIRSLCFEACAVPGHAGKSQHRDKLPLCLRGRVRCQMPAVYDEDVD